MKKMELLSKQGKSEEEALSSVLEELETTKDEILYKKEHKKGGLFKGETIIISAIKVSDVQNYIKEFLQEILTKMGLEVTFETKLRENQIHIKMYSDKNYILIGKNGQTLAALQTIIRQVIFNQLEMYPYIILDVENYKDKQLRNIERLAKNIAREVAQTKVETKLDNMNSYERRIVHNILSENKKVYTESVGEEPNRYIVIKPKEE